MGLALALLTHALPAAVLSPAVDRLTTSSVGVALVGALLSCGAWIVMRRGDGERSRRLALVLTGLAVLGACGGALALDPWRELAARGLREAWPIPYFPWIACIVGGVAAPIAVPLGGLLGLVLGDERRAPLAALFASLGVGWMVAPWLVDDVLGAAHTLQVVGVLAAVAGLLVVEHGAWVARRGSLPRGAAIALVALGAVALAAGQEWNATFDRGGLPRAVFLGVAALAAACVQPIARRHVGGASRSVWLTVAVCAVVCALPVEPFVLRGGDPIAIGAVGWMITTAALAGFAFGALVCARGDGLALHAVPFVLVGFAPVVAWSVLPQFGPRLLAVCAAALVIVAVQRARPFPVGATLVLGLAAIASLAGWGPRPPAGAVLAERRFRGADGVACEVRDEATQRTLVAIDGRAAFGRSSGQERRFAHLPLLLHGPAQRVLVIGTAATETAHAAWAHGPTTLHWLRPYDEFEVPTPTDWAGSDPPTTGSERQFLALDRGDYDVVVLAPDPRVGRRMAACGSVEAFELARSRLAPTGTWCQWYDLADVDVADLEPVIAAALTVFPHVYVVADHPRTRRASLGLLLRDQPLDVDPARIERVLAERPAVATEFRAIGCDALDVACMVLAQRGVLEVLAPPELALVDDRPHSSIRRALRGHDVDDRVVDGHAFLLRCASDPIAWVAHAAVAAPIAQATLRARFDASRALRAGALAVVEAQGATGVPFELDARGEPPAVEVDAIERARRLAIPGYRGIAK
ncbi:MAG: hypothetical protein IPH13_02895 [Planctomycetes bacterium]|nr:hypothetical protein [Planctomycetota bacterium]MCC7170747.1 hypothetical protein [Planctomycetota bacterium]